jgi:hypothetical protein
VIFFIAIFSFVSGGRTPTQQSVLTSTGQGSNQRVKEDSWRGRHGRGVELAQLWRRSRLASVARLGLLSGGVGEPTLRLSASDRRR